jgi:hypothetical protein
MLFLKIYGYSLIVLAFLSYLCIFNVSYDIRFSHFLFYGGIIIATWYLITGVGILIKKKWGYYLFKFFLYVLLVSFPIGTIISYLSLQYMKRNDIKKFF